MVELEAAAHRLELRLLERGHEGLLVGDVAFDLRQRRVEEQRCVVTLRGVLRGDAAEFLFELSDELLAGRIAEVRSPEGARDYAERRVFQRGQCHAVGRGIGEERNLTEQAGLLVLPDEAHTETAGVEGVNRIGFLRGDLGELRGEVGLVERGVNLVDNFALIKSLKAGDEVLTRLVVGRHTDHPFVAFVGSVLADDFCLGVVLPGDNELVRRTLRTGDRRRTRVRTDQKDLFLGDRFVHRHEHVGEGKAGDDRYLVALDQLLRDLHCDVGFELAVLLDYLDRDAAELSSVALDDQHERVILLLPDRALRAGEFGHEADFDRRLRKRRGREHQGYRCN